MTILTENIVLSRTRAQDLNSVRKLNCWGSELSDVAIVKRMQYVEVLSLSVNNINTLADFASCRNLQELYLRKNHITDLNEVCYLQGLPRLHSLWLADNPCAENEKYRLTVLRALPNLEKLDNIFVQPDEIDRARIHGLPLSLPKERNKSPVIDVSPQSPMTHSVQENRYDSWQDKREAEVEPYRGGVCSAGASSRMQELPFNGSDYSDNPTQLDAMSSSRRRTTMILNEEDDDEQSVMMASTYSTSSSSSPVIMPQHQHVFHARVQTLVDHSGRRSRKSTEISCDTCGTLLEEQQALESGNGQDGIMSRSFEQYSDPDGAASSGDGYRHVLRESDARSVQSEVSGYVEHKGAAVALPQRIEKGSPARILPKGGKNRNSNILSAVLCLIKELDYASLEVVETAIHCRMEEMDD